MFLRIRRLCFLGFVVLGCAAAHAEPPNITARLSGTTITTSDFETTVRFYVDLLGFKETRRRALEAPASRGVFGLTDQANVMYAALTPHEWTQDNPYLSSLNVVVVPTDLSDGVARETGRRPYQGEVTLAYRVTGLEQIHEQVVANGVPVVTPLATSATGRSRTLTILDPNGVRIHLYEYPEAESEPESSGP